MVVAHLRARTTRNGTEVYVLYLRCAPARATGALSAGRAPVSSRSRPPPVRTPGTGRVACTRPGGVLGAHQGIAVAKGQGGTDGDLVAAEPFAAHQAPAAGPSIARQPGDLPDPGGQLRCHGRLAQLVVEPAGGTAVLSGSHQGPGRGIGRVERDHQREPDDGGVGGGLRHDRTRPRPSTARSPRSDRARRLRTPAARDPRTRHRWRWAPAPPRRPLPPRPRERSRRRWTTGPAPWPHGSRPMARSAANTASTASRLVQVERDRGLAGERRPDGPPGPPRPEVGRCVATRSRAGQRPR